MGLKVDIAVALKVPSLKPTPDSGISMQDIIAQSKSAKLRLQDWLSTMDPAAEFLGDIAPVSATFCIRTTATVASILLSPDKRPEFIKWAERSPKKIAGFPGMATKPRQR